MLNYYTSILYTDVETEFVWSSIYCELIRSELKTLADLELLTCKWTQCCTSLCNTQHSAYIHIMIEV